METSDDRFFPFCHSSHAPSSAGTRQPDFLWGLGKSFMRRRFWEGWSLRSLAHLMTSTQAAMACPSSISEHPRPWHSGCHRSATPLPRAQNKARSSLAASPSLRISASRDAAARVLGARFVVFRQSFCRTRNARIWTPPKRLTREPNN